MPNPNPQQGFNVTFTTLKTIKKNEFAMNKPLSGFIKI